MESPAASPSPPSGAKPRRRQRRRQAGTGRLEQSLDSCTNQWVGASSSLATVVRPEDLESVAMELRDPWNMEARISREWEEGSAPATGGPEREYFRKITEQVAQKNR